MGITIRDADLKDDREEIIRFLHENLTASSNAARFEWLYLQNPSGQARAWMAVDSCNRTIGIAAAFPRHFSIASEVHRVWVLGDFCIAKDYRSLGPALKLQRAALESLSSGDNSICYDFPSKAMMSVYGRLGVRTLGSHVRYVKLLQVDEKVQQFVRQRFLARSLSRIGNSALGFRRTQRLPVEVDFSMQQREFGEEFSAMNLKTKSLHPIKASHSAEYLNWRYVDNPLRQYCAVVARRQSDLFGYAVVEVDGNHSRLTELQAVDSEKCLPGLLSYVDLLLRDMDVHSVAVSVLQDCYLIPHLRRAGFHAREGVPIIAYASREATWPTDIHDSKNWMLLYGDRES
jgi:hypothetical protein